MPEGLARQRHAYVFILIVPRQLIWLEPVFHVLLSILLYLLLEGGIYAFSMACQPVAPPRQHLLAGPNDKRLPRALIDGEISQVHLLHSVNDSALGGH